METCNQCDAEMYDNDNTCRECGLVTNESIFSSYCYDEQPQKLKMRVKDSKLEKMQKWMMWTNDERNEYKLKEYVRNFCQELDVVDAIVPDVFYFVLQVMTSIKSTCDGPKRSSVKDGIIIVCIYYVSKSIKKPCSYIELSRKINLNMKYISRADKLIMELITSKKLKIPDRFLELLQKIETPIEYIQSIIEKFQLTIDRRILTQVEDLIGICKDNDILVDHMPMSIGVSCFYYVLFINNIDLSVKTFSEMYDLSVATVSKTFNKLKVYTEHFERMGIRCINQIEEQS